MTAFTVIRDPDAPFPFAVIGPDGLPAAAVDAFLAHLANRGHSPYTLRAYAIGVADFLCWLHPTGRALDHVTQVDIQHYIEAFRTGAKRGACHSDPQRAGQINLLTRKVAPAQERQPRTINHRLSVLTSFFAYRREQEETGGQGEVQPVPVFGPTRAHAHGMTGRDAPRRGRIGDLRRRVAWRLPARLDPELVAQLITAATSWRDKALLTLLYRTGQRIGDWSTFAGRHGVLGMTLADLDERSSTITVFLKGARDEHRVPVTEDFWPLFRQYLAQERRADPGLAAAWVGLRKGAGKPLSYRTFESALRYSGRKIGANVHAHMFRHTVAQAIVGTGNLKAAQDLLGHRHLTTTMESYARTDEQAMVRAVAAVKRQFDTARAEPPTQRGRRYVFAYDQATIDTLEQVTTPRAEG